jgi:hypothetical protein
MNIHFKLNRPLPQEVCVPRTPTFSSNAPGCSPGILSPNFPRSNLMELLRHNAMYFIVSKCRNDIEGSVRLCVQVTAFYNTYEGITTAREQTIPGSKDRRNGSANICAESQTQYAERRRTLSSWVDNEDDGFLVTNCFLGQCDELKW